ncbi:MULTISPECIES: hypothetical protein [unclassified Luteococcus]|uniref:hypothetical protein n=1 Tax=unclassified Luteococcus TaxID=2639923 RepID=UPI00313C2F31
MKKLFHVVIGLGTAVFFLGGLLFVLGQTLFLVLGKPEMIIAIEDRVDDVIFPAIAIVGVLCYLYSVIYPQKKKESAEQPA